MNSNIVYLFVIIYFVNGVISNDIIINGSTEPNIPSASTVTPAPNTTIAPNSTIAPTNITTTTTIKTTQTTVTTPKTTITTPTTTLTPNITTIPTTLSPNVTSTTESTTAQPTVAPHKGRKFDGPSFFGGIILASGLMAISFVSWKFYKARTERNYHTL